MFLLLPLGQPADNARGLRQSGNAYATFGDALSLFSIATIVIGRDTRQPI